MSTLDPRPDDRPIPQAEASRMIRRLIAGAVRRPGQVVATDPPRPAPVRPAAAGIAGRRIAIPGYDPADPKLAEVLAELEARRTEGRDRQGGEQP